jgi:phosphonate transport system substrate-binding protein
LAIYPNPQIFWIFHQDFFYNIPYMTNALIGAGLLLIMIVSCTGSDTNAPKKAVEQKRILLIGLVPEENIFKQMDRYEPLARYVSQKVGIIIQLKVLPAYGDIINNFVSSHLDGAFFGSFAYVLASAKLGLVPLVRPEEVDGTSTYHGLIIVRKDSGIRSAKEMKNKRFAFVDKATTAGYLLPLDYFRENGIRDYNKYLKETYFAGTHEDVIYDVLYGKTDIGAAKNTVFERLSNIDDRVKDELLVLATSPDVPENGLAMRKTVDNAVRDKIKETLLVMNTDPEGMKILRVFGARRFITTADKDYESVYTYARHLNINLATYDYTKE